MKKIVAALSVWIGVFIFALPVFAHVTVQPSTSTLGAWETYTVKVPVEKDQATTKVALKIPKGVEFSSYEPVEGWKTTIAKNDTGEVTTVTWEATGEGILPGQFQRFSFIAANQDVNEEIVWDAYQYYKDGSIVEWTGDEGTDTPHAVTTITKEAVANSSVTSDKHSNRQQGDTEKVQEEDKVEGLEMIINIISIVVILLSFTTIFFLLRRMKKGSSR